jgi:Flp pilus assembly protein CpaB
MKATVLVGLLLSQVGLAEEVVIATRDLPAGSVLAETDVQLKEWPAAWATEGMAVRRDLKRLVGQRTVVPLVRGDVIRRVWVASEGTAGALCVERVQPATADMQLTALRRGVVRKR